jgi:cytochrome c oxidase assembly protein subunit 11
MDNRADHQELTRKNARTGLAVLAAVFIMLGVSFAAVPMYRLFCQVTGFGGTTMVSEALPDKVLERRVTVKFNADTGRNMPWDFKPVQREITVQLGQRGLAAYTAHNRATKPIGGTAVYNVTPLKAGPYFNKIQCFCFDEQVLQPGQTADMPVLFFIDPAMNDDPNMDDVSTITLSYTFYESHSKALEDALEAFYNTENIDIKETH